MAIELVEAAAVCQSTMVAVHGLEHAMTVLTHTQAWRTVCATAYRLTATLAIAVIAAGSGMVQFFFPLT